MSSPVAKECIALVIQIRALRKEIISISNDLTTLNARLSLKVGEAETALARLQEIKHGLKADNVSVEELERLLRLLQKVEDPSGN